MVKMIKIVMIKELIMESLSDGKFSSVPEMKDCAEGQFSGSVDNLLKNRKIKKIDRGRYRIAGMQMNLAEERNGYVDVFWCNCNYNSIDEYNLDCKGQRCQMVQVY